MSACPVCDTPRTAGDACEVCGRPFPAADRSGPPVPPLEGLEATLHAAVLPAVERIPDLEPTGSARVPEVAAPPVEGLEVTRVAPGAPAPLDLLSAPLDGFEPTLADPVPGASAPPGPVVCRYCRTPATDAGPLCTRCGMRLPLVRPARPEAAAARRPCSDCGTPTTGAKCPACGARQAGD